MTRRRPYLPSAWPPILFALAVLGLLAWFLVAFPAPAHATDQDEPRSTTLVAWLITGEGDDIWGDGQTLAASVALDDPTLDALDGMLAACGRYQVDLYWTGPTTDALLAGGILYGPSNPTEDLAYGAVDGNPWKYLTVETCPEPTVEPTPEPTPTEAPPTTTPEPTVEATPAVVEVHTVATPASTAPTLAATGPADPLAWLAALVLVVLGVTMVAIRKRRPTR